MEIEISFICFWFPFSAIFLSNRLNAEGVGFRSLVGIMRPGADGAPRRAALIGAPRLARIIRPPQAGALLRAHLPIDAH
mgnify:CR=1 FL=1